MIPPNGHHASAHSPPDFMWPTACQPTTRSPEPGWGAGPNGSLPPRRPLSGEQGPWHRWRWGSGPFVLLSWPSASPPGGPGVRFARTLHLRVRMVGEASQEDRWIADGEDMEAKARSARRCEDHTPRLVADLRLVGDRRRSRSPDASNRRRPLGSLPIADSPAVGREGSRSARGCRSVTAPAVCGGGA
jgi:hypothetical protein